MARDDVGEDLGLIEFPLSLPRGVQRDWDDCIDRGHEDPFVRHSGKHPLAELMPEMKLPLVFEAVNEIAHHPYGAVGRHGAGKAKMAAVAIATSEFLGDGAAERLGTLAAERRHNPFGAIRAFLAEMPTGFAFRLARGAVRRIDKRQKGAACRSA